MHNSYHMIQDAVKCCSIQCRYINEKHRFQTQTSICLNATCLLKAANLPFSVHMTFLFEAVAELTSHDTETDSGVSDNRSSRYHTDDEGVSECICMSTTNTCRLLIKKAIFMVLIAVFMNIFKP